MFRKKYYYLILAVFISLTALMTGCSKKDTPDIVQSRFNTFMNDIFIDEVQTDTLSLNYSLANPENYGIKSNKVTLGEYSIRYMNKELSLSENYLDRLKRFKYSLLSPNQRLTYNIVKNYYQEELDLGNYLYYYECLGPTTGIQAQLPILLAEYSFNDKDDIEQYLKLLPCVKEYFKEIAQFEREKSKKGLFMSDAVADRIIDQCEAFIKKPEENFLIGYFNEKIISCSYLSEAEITDYKLKNQEAVLNYVIPAYSLLINALSELKGTGTNNAGLCNYPDGKAYYECLAKYKTGSDKSMEEMIQMLEKAINKGITNISNISLADASIKDKYLNFTSFPITNPQEILNDLKHDITKDFPAAVPVNCEIKYVPKSLSEYLSPAMYLVPPIDSYRNNDIYINGNDNKTLSMIYTTVAHEGYPGHLYQCVYFRSKKPAPVRSIMDFVGYDEGWATYVEFYSYHLAGIDENLADFLEDINSVILCMYARADIGIQYEGWSKLDAITYINNFIGSKAKAQKIYSTLLEEPVIYLPYAIGYLEIMELREKAEDALGKNFVAKDFHKFLLDIGPAQFGIIDNYLNSWITEEKKLATKK